MKSASRKMSLQRVFVVVGLDILLDLVHKNSGIISVERDSALRRA
jgi:cell division protein ZapA (FtsZ GTPase activity inhibitor)